MQWLLDGRCRRQLDPERVDQPARGFDLNNGNDPTQRGDEDQADEERRPWGHQGFVGETEGIAEFGQAGSQRHLVRFRKLITPTICSQKLSAPVIIRMVHNTFLYFGRPFFQQSTSINTANTKTII